MHYVQKNNLFLARSQEYQRTGMKITDVITSRLLLIFPEIIGKFPEILNFRKIYNPIDISLLDSEHRLQILQHWREELR